MLKFLPDPLTPIHLVMKKPYQEAALIVQRAREGGASTEEARAFAVKMTGLSRAKVAQADRDHNF